MHANRCLSWALTFLVLNSEFVAARPWHDTLNPLYSRLEPWIPSSLLKRSNVDLNPNGTTFLWLIDDVFEGKTFFDNFEFFKWADPTNGRVNYIDKDAAFAQGLAFVTDDDKVIMQGDNTTWLDRGQFRNSVRIQGHKQYNTGLFILDVDKAPWGCAVWPAFWTVGMGGWPQSGEIDIIEGVHDNSHNQVTWHSGSGCHLTPNATFSGTVVEMDGKQHLDCDGLLPGNPGCGITEWSRASYGPLFDAQGGGVYAMKWDENGISVWSFYRAAVPQDITDGSPNPSGWGVPVGTLLPTNCNPLSKYFYNHSVIFDITFCGDWAGNSYATSGCPGTCEDRLMDPNNFVNATWIINSLKIYRKTMLNTRPANAAPRLEVSIAQLGVWGTLLFVLSAL